MNISIVVAYDENNVIGVDNDIPWKLPSDMKNFRKITTGGTVIMGRKTYDSIPDRFKPLPKRRNIVLTTNKDWTSEGVEVAHSLSEAVKLVANDTEAFVIGGETVYEAFLPSVKTMYISHVKTGGEIKGHAFFPVVEMDDHFDEEYWEEIDEEKDDFPYTFAVYKRKKNV